MHRLATITVLVLSHATGLAQKAGERLLDIIHEDFQQPRPVQAAADPQVTKIFQWSAEVNRLACRIEYTAKDWAAGYTVLMRIENRGGSPLRVPMGNPLDTRRARVYELHSREPDGPWQRTPWLPGEHLDGPGPEIKPESIAYGCWASGNSATRDDLLLFPGKSALVYLCGSPFDEHHAAEIKIILHCEPDPEDAATWHGVLESAAFPADLSNKKLRACTGALEPPDYFPQLSRVAYRVLEEPRRYFSVLAMNNGPLLRSMAIYRRDSLWPILERGLAHEQNEHLKLLIASEAAWAGSEVAARFVRQGLFRTDGDMVFSTHGALSRLLGRYGRERPRWLVELVQSAVQDRRKITVPAHGKGMWEHDEDTLGELARSEPGFTSAIAQAARQAEVPGLLVRAQGDDTAAFRAVSSLSESDDPRAVPLLYERLLRSSRDGIEDMGAGGGPGFRDFLRALVKLKAKVVVPALLERLHLPGVVQALHQLNDPRALPALQRLLESKGVIPGRTETAEVIRERLAAVRSAIDDLDPQIRTERLCKQLNDPASDETLRNKVLLELRHVPDSRAIPALLNLVRSDPSGLITCRAIGALSFIRHRDSIAGLIDCFDVPFKTKQYFRQAMIPRDYQKCLASALRNLTDQDYGWDKAPWAAWWQAKGQHLEWKQPAPSEDDEQY